MTLQEQEEADLQKAIDLSNNPMLPMQESGVTAPDKQYFGPVRSEYHDTKNWIMTTSKPTAKEILLNPEANFRRRLAEAPAFLRPSPARHRLPGLIKILHTVPAAREALLCRECLQTQYDHHNEWWDGVPIQSAQIVHSEEVHDKHSQDVIYECQRLMAFLDETKRAYGSSEALSTLPGIRECNGDSVIREFLDTWCDAVMCHSRSAPMARIFQSRGIRTRGGDQDTEDTTILDLSVDESSFESGQTLYETMDSILWPNWDGSDPEHEVFLDKVADVFIVRISRRDDTAKSLDIKFPPVWYSDRYRKSSQPRIRQTLADRAAIKKEMDELDARKARVSALKSTIQPGKSVEINRLLHIAQQYFEKSATYQGTPGNPVSSVGEDDGVPRMERYNRIAEELKLLSERVARKLRTFEESKDKAREQLRELSKLFTEPSDDVEDSPRDRYTLRGVCADVDTVYVQERMKSSPGTDLAIREIEVLKAIRHEASSAILVYASDRAMLVEEGDLPAQLKAFAAELASSPSPEPTTSPKRRAPDEIDLAPYQGSPPQDRPPPPYNSDHTFSRPPHDRSYDEYIPVSLRDDSMEKMMDVDEGVEMSEADGGGGTGRIFVYEGRGDGYRLGDSVPEIEMELEEKGGEGKGQ
ncbi:MAG: hypothetical protein LQ352_000402 [Teloschistes flavicans]|nr:MAG: hypothetical protein LQ352_000402 [Teloschistes flavicans]